MADDHTQDAGMMMVEMMIQLTLARLLGTHINEVFGVDLDHPAETQQEQEFEAFIEAVVPSITGSVFNALRDFLKDARVPDSIWHKRALEMVHSFDEHLQESHGMELVTYLALKEAEENMVAGVSTEPCDLHGLQLDAAAFKGTTTVFSEDKMHELHLKKFEPAEDFCSDIDCYRPVVEALSEKIIQDHIENEHPHG